MHMLVFPSVLIKILQDGCYCHPFTEEEMVVLKGKATSQSQYLLRKLIPKSVLVPLPPWTTNQHYLSHLSNSTILPLFFQGVQMFGFNCLSISAMLPDFLGILAIVTC